MLLIFGGTTEGRVAVSTCDEAGKPFYYSTKGAQQKVESAHGIQLTGALNEIDMRSFCTAKGIQLIIDAAHPFAEQLHQHIAATSQALSIPVIRLERTYPERDDTLIWLDSYPDTIAYLTQNKITNLLALTGVNTIGKLKPYWQKHPCRFRILDREESRQVAVQAGFPLQLLCYSTLGDNEASLFKQLAPQAILVKESGLSGGFNEKVAAASQLNIPVLVVKRPPMPPSFVTVYGEHGLRKQIETLYSHFFPLRTGYTTGTCATAATKAALITLLTGKELQEVAITLPNGEEVSLPIANTQIKPAEVSCTVRKEAGDDPDITHGHAIVSTVQQTDSHPDIRFLQGMGVGKVTLPGLGLAIGQPAINPTPRQMIAREIAHVMRQHPPFNKGIEVTLSVPDGEEIARKTFNPKLGIVGGISILGTSGIVRPFSSAAFVAAIRREMQVAKAVGCTHIVINSGAKSERFIKQHHPNLPPLAFIHFGNFIGETIQIASELEIPTLTLGIMIGKAVKLAEGFLDTHSKKVVMNRDFLVALAQQAHCSEATLAAIGHITLARQLWEIIPKHETCFFATLLQKCHDVCKPLYLNGNFTVVLLDENGDCFI